ncbi:MAG: hypothetical protein MUF04_10785 [Akkermansiaceae bacterium]|nr:hypothetical protein [Akkermansiaceae bacterium]
MEFGKRVGGRLEGTGGGLHDRMQVGLELQPQIPGMIVPGYLFLKDSRSVIKWNP